MQWTARGNSDPALGVLVGFHVGQPGDAFMIRSSGLPEFGLLNVEARESGRDVQETAAMLQHWIGHMIGTGEISDDGSTIGGAGQRVDVRHAPASWGGEVSIHLAFSVEQGDVVPPLMCCPARRFRAIDGA